MEKFCQNCGSALTEGTKFCPSCGTPVAQSAQPTQQQPSQQPQQQPKPYTPKPQVKIPEEFAQRNAARTQQKAAPVKKQKGKGGFAKLVAVILVLCIVVTGFVKPGFFLKSLKGKNDQGNSSAAPGQVMSSESASVNLDAPAVTLCGVTVDVDELMLKDGPRNVSVSVLEDGTDRDGSRYELYELSMDGSEDFYVPVEVTFPCTVSADTDVVVEHYVDGSWMPLISYVDKQAGTVTAYFGSFSPARVSYRPVGVNPSLFYVITDEENPYYQTVEVRSNYWYILQRTNPAEYSDEVTRYIDDPENYAVEVPKLDPNMDLKAAYEGFTKANTLWGFCDPLINIGMEGLPMSSQSRVINFLSDHASDLGNAMNLIPILTMTAQVAYDMRDMDLKQIDTAGINLYKNLINSSGTIYSMVTGYSHIGFTLTFFGVALFGMELDYFVDAAKAEQAENVKAVFEAYYNEIEFFDSDHWFQVFYDAYWETDGNPDAAMAVVKTAVDDYCGKFWNEVYDETNEDILFAADAAGYKNVFFNASDELKASLTEQQKAKVWQLIETKSMEKIQRFLLEQLQINTLKELAKIAEPYNRTLHFQITETVNLESTDVAKYKGCTVAFGSDGVPVPGWHQSIPDSEEYDDGWSTDFDCTMYGYLNMGMPNQVLVYASEEDFANGAAPIFTKNFTPQMTGNRSTEIELGSPTVIEEDENQPEDNSQQTEDDNNAESENQESGTDEPKEGYWQLKETNVTPGEDEIGTDGYASYYYSASELSLTTRVSLPETDYHGAGSATLTVNCSAPPQIIRPSEDVVMHLSVDGSYSGDYMLWPASGSVRYGAPNDERNAIMYNNGTRFAALEEGGKEYVYLDPFGNDPSPETTVVHVFDKGTRAGSEMAILFSDGYSNTLWIYEWVEESSGEDPTEDDKPEDDKPKEENGYWQLKETNVTPREDEIGTDGYASFYYSASELSHTTRVSIPETDYHDAGSATMSVSCSAPPQIIRPDEDVIMHLSVELSCEGYYLLWSMYGDVGCGEPNDERNGIMYNDPIYFAATEEGAKYRVYLDTIGNTPCPEATVHHVFGNGYQSGDEMAIIFSSSAGNTLWIYEWVE
ncbi:MAG: zinc ribbon domain-containing protein [Oscillospiraceae bacterium]|nr:zinc ribbon domain-containing protein [Oscillospiraceae bacterium]